MPTTKTEEEMRDQFLLAGIATGPATLDDINSLEQSLGVQLPMAYRAYLGVCGTRPPQALVGSDCTMQQITDINVWAAELIDENSVSSTFPKRFFVFLMHQGYTFLWFPLDGSDDPPCFCYLEGDTESKPVAHKFSYWVRGLA